MYRMQLYDTPHCPPSVSSISPVLSPLFYLSRLGSVGRNSPSAHHMPLLTSTQRIVFYNVRPSACLYGVGFFRYRVFVRDSVECLHPIAYCNGTNVSESVGRAAQCGLAPKITHTVRHFAARSGSINEKSRRGSSPTSRCGDRPCALPVA
jgi:hypothetical protein